MRRILIFLAMFASLAACGGAGRADITIAPMPDGASFHGVWQSPQYGDMHLCQTGSSVIGDYEKDERRGRIQGTIQGNTLRYTWEERRQMVVGRTQVTRGRGYFQLVLGEDNNQYFTGEWGVDEQETGGGPWNAAKLNERRRPTRCTSMESSGGSSSSSSGGYDDYDSSDSYDSNSDSGSSYESDTPTDNSDVDTEALEGLDEF